MKRTVLRVRPAGLYGQWRVYGPEGNPLTSGATKAETVKRARAMALELAAAGAPAQVVIYLRNGRIEEERTYPRRTDPRRRQG